MSGEFEVVGNIKYYEVEGMICTGNSSQIYAKNALVSDIFGTIFIPETITFFNVKRRVELIENRSFEGCSVKSVYVKSRILFTRDGKKVRNYVSIGQTC